VVYVADTFNHRVRTYHAKEGEVRAFAGTGTKGFAGDGGPADKVQFDGPHCVAFDPDKKNLYLTDLGNRRIRKIDMATKEVTTVAGNGQKGVPKDGEDALKQPLLTRGRTPWTRTATSGFWSAAATPFAL
jgi:DNA-binding beta-propeller fold protein YncE